MGIGISFTGRDGRTQSGDADSLGSAKSLLGEMMHSAEAAIGRLGRGRNAAKVTNITNNYPRGKKPRGGGEVKVDPFGSVENSPDGLRLIGDRNAGLVRSGKLYGFSVAGLRGWWNLFEIDPPQDGQPIGPTFTTSEDEDKSERKSDDLGAFRVSVVSRELFAPVAGSETLKIHYLFLRDISFTAAGRACAVSGERRVCLGMVNFGGGSGGADISQLNDVAFVTDIEYTADFRIKASRKKFVVTNGVLSLDDATPQYIDTTPLSSEWTASS